MNITRLRVTVTVDGTKQNPLMGLDYEVHGAMSRSIQTRTARCFTARAATNGTAGRTSSRGPREASSRADGFGGREPDRFASNKLETSATTQTNVPRGRRASRVASCTRTSRGEADGQAERRHSDPL